MSLKAFVKKIMTRPIVHHEAFSMPRHQEFRSPERAMEVEMQLRRDLFGPDHERVLARRKPQFYYMVQRFWAKVPRYSPYLYPTSNDAFTGKTAMFILNHHMGVNAEYVAAFMFKHKMVRNVGFGRVDGIKADDTRKELIFSNFMSQ